MFWAPRSDEAPQVSRKSRHPEVQGSTRAELPIGMTGVTRRRDVDFRSNGGGSLLSGLDRQRSDSNAIVVEHHDGACFEVGLDRREVHEEQSGDLARAPLALTPEEHDRRR